MAAHVLGHPGTLDVAVGYAAPPTEASADLLARALAHAGIAEVVRYRVGPSVGAHTGPLSFGAFWWPAGRADHSGGGFPCEGPRR